MTQTKPWWTSRTIWAALVILFASISGLFGIDLDQDAQKIITDNIVNIVDAVGALLVIFGRKAATHRIQ